MTSTPDLLLLVRGGGAAASLTALDDQDLARVIAMLPIPLVAGLGHAVDLTLADRVAWRSADTPSKALGFLREHLVAPARRARANHAAILTQVSAGLDRAGPSLAAIEHRIAAEVLRHAVAASEDLDNRWSGVRAAAGAACEHLARRDDALARLASDIAAAPAVILGRTEADLATMIEAVRAQARRAAAGADDGAGHLAAATVRSVALVETADAGLAALGRGIPAWVLSRSERAAHEIDALAAKIRTSARDRLGRADDGARALTLVTTTVAEVHSRQVAEIDRLTRAIETAVVRRIEAAAAALERVAAVLDGADPARVLEHGYALVTDLSGRPVTSIATARAAAVLTLMLADGTIAVRVVDPQPQSLGYPS